MRRIMIILVLLFAFNNVGNCQLRLQVDSILTHKLSDETIRSWIVIGSVYEDLFMDGPLIIVKGSVINDGESSVIFEKWELCDYLTWLNFKVDFCYRAKKYQVNFDNLCELTDDVRPRSYNGLRILEPGQSVPVDLRYHLFSKTDLCHLRKRYSQSRNKSFNIRENKRLEKILFKVLPTISITPRVVEYDEANGIEFDFLRMPSI